MERHNRSKSAVRAHVEPPFLHIKRLWGYAKTRYWGLAKNANRLIAMCALYNVRRATCGDRAVGIGAPRAGEGARDEAKSLAQWIDFGTFKSFLGPTNRNTHCDTIGGA